MIRLLRSWQMILFHALAVGTDHMLDEISEWLEAVKPTVINWYEGNIEQVAADATADILYQVNRVIS